MELPAAFRHQSRSCAELGSPMYAELLARCADDLEAGSGRGSGRSVLRDLLAGHEDDPGPSALALRLLGSVHRLVLERRAPELALHYPSVGGTWEPEGGWRAFVALLRREPAAVAEWLDRPPQTNEVGRSTALLGGLLHLPRDLPVRLLEIGSSAGLNLRADRYAYLDEGGRRFGAGASDLVVEGAWRGRRLEPWPGLEVVERLGSDVMPVDPTTTTGRLALTAYVWPDQQARLERLRAALRVADAVPAEVRRESAAAFVAAAELREGTTTVLWHSVMWQYLSADEQGRVTRLLDDLGASATAERRLAHLRAEPSRRTPDGDHEFLVRLTTWPGAEERILGATVGHGVPTTWE